MFLLRTVNGKTHASRVDLREFVPNAQTALQKQCSFAVCHLTASLLLLAFFAEDELAFVANAFAFVGLGLAPCANVRGDLANQLFVDAFHNFGLLSDSDCHALGAV